MIEFDVKHDLEKMISSLEGFTQAELTRATVRALTSSAYDAQYSIRKEMQSVFQNPRPFTLNSLYVSPATPQNLVASVQFREYAGKGVSAGRYLQPQVFGGPRTQKGSERLISRLSVGGRSLYLAPGPAARLDAYGNIPAAKYVQVLSYLKAFPEVGYLANRTARSQNRKRTRARYIMILPDTPDARLSPGIYETRGKALLKIFNILTEPPRYTKRLEFYEIAQRRGGERFEINFELALKNIIARRNRL